MWWKTMGGGACADSWPPQINVAGRGETQGKGKTERVSWEEQEIKGEGGGRGWEAEGGRANRDVLSVLRPRS